MSELLNIEHLSVSFAAEEGKMEAVRDVSFSLKAEKFWQLSENPVVGKVYCAKVS